MIAHNVHAVFIKDQDKYIDAWEWSITELGPHRVHLPKEKWRWWTNSTTSDTDGSKLTAWCFVNKQDAMLFKLTWG